jgi:hypothetical protein
MPAPGSRGVERWNFQPKREASRRCSNWSTIWGFERSSSSWIRRSASMETASFSLDAPLK